MLAGTALTQGLGRLAGVLVAAVVVEACSAPPPDL